MTDTRTEPHRGGAGGPPGAGSNFRCRYSQPRGALVGADTSVAGDLSSAAAGVGDTGFEI